MADEWLKAATRPVKAAQIDTTVPNVARVWNYLVGGRDNFEADRQAARQLIAAAPVMAEVAPASRAFLRRVVSYLAAEAGIRQFLDIGTGHADGGQHARGRPGGGPVLPHRLRGQRPGRAGARAGPGSAPRPRASPATSTRTPATRAIIAGAPQTLDFGQPVGVIIIDILNFIEDAAGEPGPAGRGGARRQLPGGHAAGQGRAADRGARRWNQMAATPVFLRDRGQVAPWFNGLELVEPGIVEVHPWRPAPGDPDYPDGMPLLGAVARKP